MTVGDRPRVVGRTFEPGIRLMGHWQHPLAAAAATVVTPSPMKLIDPERVDGTQITIGRRVQFRTENGVRVERTSATLTAVYKDVDGTWRQDGLGTANRREARRKAIEIQRRLDLGKVRPRTQSIEIGTLIDRYHSHCAAKGLATTTLDKYRADLDKLRRFAAEAKITTIAQFDAEAFYRFRKWLESAKHKQGTTYADKSMSTALTITKQLSKWAWRQKLTPEYGLAEVALPTAKAKPQPCFTTDQVEAILRATIGSTHTAFAILAYSGMRIGELEQLRWDDVLLDRGDLGMFHIRRGGSNGRTKDKDERFVPIHPRVRPLIDELPKSGDLLLPGLRERRLLTQLKAICRTCGFSVSFKLHSFRHHFASMCANHHVAYRKALAWLGHSDSDILELYYHLHDEESEAAMRALADARVKLRG